MIHSQFAFMKGRSTETALSRVVDKIESALLRQKHGIGVFLDIKGAFDNLDHAAAIKLMEKRELPSTFIKWYGFYLQNRSATITLAGISSTRKIMKGTPQGGVLSPVLWNIAFEPLLRRMGKFAYSTGFADDGSALVVGTDLQSCQQRLAHALREAEEWGRETGLSFAPEKTIAVLFTRKSKIPDTNFDLYVDGNKIQYVESVKCLGVILDSKLNWNKHIDDKVNQAKKYIHSVKTSISRTWGPTPEKMLWLWKAVVRPKIAYASYIWGTNLTLSQRNKLNKIQRLALMQLGNFRFTTPESGLDVTLGQLPLDLHLLSRAILTHLRVRDLVPKNWAGKGPGQNGKPGHIKRIESALTTLKVPTVNLDQIPKDEK